jgi:hypothetical protein
MNQSHHLEITTYIGCPNMCSYCPQDLLIKSYKGEKRMSLDTFDKILKNVPTDIDIHFSGFSELFFHPNAIDFIRRACETHQVVIYTTTNGLTQESADQLKHFNFKLFVVHSNQRKSNVTLDFPHSVITVNDSNKISRGGNLWEVKEHEGVCSNSPSYKQNVVLPNGDVYLCCMDYGLNHKVGNLLNTNFNDLNRCGNYELCKTCEKFI